MSLELLGQVGVGIGPNGLAYDPGKDLLLAANVGDPDIPDSSDTSEQEPTGCDCASTGQNSLLQG
jgi:hypothetical protein